MKKSRSRTAVETALKRKLRVVLKLELGLLAALEIVVQEFAEQLNPANSATSSIVTARLLARIASDARSIQLLLQRGYGLQALSLAASTYEHLMTVAYIGGQEHLATEWAKWDNPFKVPTIGTMSQEIRARTGMRTVRVTKGGGKEGDALYTILCCAKHGNPVMHTKHEVITSADQFFGWLDPDGSKDVHTQAQLTAYALGTAMILAMSVLEAEGVIVFGNTSAERRFVDSMEQVEENWKRRRSARK